jgi:predicted RNase H-like HicB family nuclease
MREQVVSQGKSGKEAFESQKDIANQALNDIIQIKKLILDAEGLTYENDEYCVNELSNDFFWSSDQQKFCQ